MESWLCKNDYNWNLECLQLRVELYGWNPFLFQIPLVIEDTLDSSCNWVRKLQSNRWNRRNKSDYTCFHKKQFILSGENFCKRKSRLTRAICKKVIVGIFWNYFSSLGSRLSLRTLIFTNLKFVLKYIILYFLKNLIFLQ